MVLGFAGYARGQQKAAWHARSKKRYATWMHPRIYKDLREMKGIRCWRGRPGLGLRRKPDRVNGAMPHESIFKACHDIFDGVRIACGHS